MSAVWTLLLSLVLCPSLLPLMGVCSVKFLSAFVCLLSLMCAPSVKFVGLFVCVYCLWQVFAVWILLGCLSLCVFTVSDGCFQCEFCWAVCVCLLFLMGVCSVNCVGLFVFVCVYSLWWVFAVWILLGCLFLCVFTVSDRCLQCEVWWAVCLCVCLQSLTGVCSVKFGGLCVFVCAYCLWWVFAVWSLLGCLSSCWWVCGQLLIWIVCCRT